MRCMVFFLLALTTTGFGQDVWPQFRGPNQDGTSDANAIGRGSLAYNWVWTESSGFTQDLSTAHVDRTVFLEQGHPVLLSPWRFWEQALHATVILHAPKIATILGH